MGYKFAEVKKNLESQKITVGIGYYMLEGMKKLEDFGKAFDKKFKDFKTKKEYLDAKEAFEAPAVDALELYQKKENKKISLYLRMPTLDEVMKLASKDNEIPEGLELDLTEKNVLEVVLDFTKAKTTSAESVNEALKIVKNCYIGTSFEDDPAVDEIIKVIKSNQQFSTYVVQEFFDQSMGK